MIGVYTSDDGIIPIGTPVRFKADALLEKNFYTEVEGNKGQQTVKKLGFQLTEPETSEEIDFLLSFFKKIFDGKQRLVCLEIDPIVEGVTDAKQISTENFMTGGYLVNGQSFDDFTNQSIYDLAIMSIMHKFAYKFSFDEELEVCLIRAEKDKDGRLVFRVYLNHEEEPSFEFNNLFEYDGVRSYVNKFLKG